MHHLRRLKTLSKLNIKSFTNEATKTAAGSSGTVAPANAAAGAASLPEIASLPVTAAVALPPKPQKLIVDEITARTSSSIGDNFDHIPGPQILRYSSYVLSKAPISAMTIQYFIATGCQLTWTPYPWMFKKLFDEYGPVVRLHAANGGDVVMLGRIDDIKDVFKNEGPFPVRSSIQSLEKYRLEYRKFRYSGPFLMFGSEWENIRRMIERPLNGSIAVHKQHIDDISQVLVQRIMDERNRQYEMSSFKRHIQKWSMECLFAVVVNKRLGFQDNCGLSSTSTAGILLDGLIGVTAGLQITEKWGFHVWKMITAPAWVSFVKHCDSLDEVFGKYVEDAQSGLNQKKPDQLKNLTLLESMLLNKNELMADDVLTVLLDLMVVGVNTTTHVVRFLLYHLAKYPSCQRTLYDKIKEGDTSYMKACIRESLRLKPPFPIVGRILGADLTIHNYQIPKGTHLLMVTNLDNMREEYYEDVHKFKPERWLNRMDNPEMFETVPFGVGSKGAIAKELTEMEITILTKRIIETFKVEYYYGDIHNINKFLTEPKRDFKFRFVVR